MVGPNQELRWRYNLAGRRKRNNSNTRRDPCLRIDYGSEQLQCFVCRDGRTYGVPVLYLLKMPYCFGIFPLPAQCNSKVENSIDDINNASGSFNIFDTLQQQRHSFVEIILTAVV